MRTGIPGEAIIELFPVFEDDGYTKTPGVPLGDFDVSFWKDGTFTPTPYVISDLGTGDYRLTFTPNEEAVWHVEVYIPYNNDIHYVDVEVRSGNLTTISNDLGQIKDGGTGLFTAEDSLHFLSLDIKRVLGLLHHNAILDQQTYDANSQLTGARLRVFDTKAHVPAVPNGNETLGLLHRYSIVAEYDGLGIQTMFQLRREQ